jgi:glycosyltransferase involved in cell wall biosynthesis
VNILLINWQDPMNPQAGGAEVHVREIFGRLQAKGHSITWLASGWKEAPAEDDLNGIKVYRTGSRHTFGVYSPIFFRRNLANKRYDLILECLNKVPVFSPLWSRTPVAILVHHLFGSTAFQQASVPLAAATWLLERPLPRVYRKSSVQALSQSTADDLIARGFDARRIQVIYPGVDLGFFTRAASPGRAILPTFLYLGRLQRYKRVDLILEAFARIIADLPLAKLVIAGTGDQETSLRQRASMLKIDRNVHFAGFVTEEQKRDLFRSAWANVLVSPKEGWGITNLEAAACGTPTIASDSPGLRESVIDGKTGLLVRHGDRECLTLALRRLAEHPDLVEDLGCAAFEFSRSFTWDRAAEETERHLERAAVEGAAKLSR